MTTSSARTIVTIALALVFPACALERRGGDEPVQGTQQALTAAATPDSLASSARTIAAPTTAVRTTETPRAEGTGQFNITDLYTSWWAVGTNQPYTPSVGEKYRVTVEWNVVGTPINPYYVEFEMAGIVEDVQVTDLTSGPKSVSWEPFLELDGPILVRAKIDAFDMANMADPTKCVIPVNVPVLDPSQTQAKPVCSQTPTVQVGLREKSISFTPIPPAVGIDNYAPRNLLGAQTLTIDLPASTSRLALMMGAPDTDGWQTVTSSSASVTTATGTANLATQPVENDGNHPVYLWDSQNVPAGEVTISQTFGVELRGQRVNADLLRTVTWAEMDGISGYGIFHHYTQPESVIESNHWKVVQFVTNTLGADYRQHYTPYDAARTLFRAVLAHVTYTFPKDGEPDLRGHTAVEMIDKGLGDCGGFSLLLVALYRQVGIPSRVAAGFWEGGGGHAWNELFFPWYGWFVADGAAGNSKSEDGTYAFNFGTNKSLNSRVAVMRGNTFNVGDLSVPWLQGPRILANTTPLGPDATSDNWFLGALQFDF